MEEIINDAPSEPNRLYRIEKMRFGKHADSSDDPSTLVYNPFITLRGIPLEAYDYVVNGKSALEWIMDRYQIKYHYPAR